MPGSPAPEPSPEREARLLPTTPGAEGWDAEADAEENSRLYYLIHLFQWFEAHRPKVADLEACPVALPVWREAAERAQRDIQLFNQSMDALATMEHSDQARRARQPQNLREAPGPRKVASLAGHWSGRLLAQGAIGRVWASVDRRTGKMVAVKTIEKGRLPRNESRSELRGKLQEELSIHRGLKHANVIELLEAREYPDVLVF